MLTAALETWTRSWLGALRTIHRQRFSGYLLTNGLIVSVFLLGYVIGKLTGWVDVRWVAIWPLYFVLPGYNLSWLFFGGRLNGLERLIVALVSSFIVVTAIVYIVAAISHQPLTVLALAATLSAYSATFLAGLIGVSRTKPVPINDSPLWRDSGFWVVVGAYAAVLIAIFRIYPFLPESDPYASLQLANQVLHFNEPVSLLTNRPLFTVLAASVALAGKIPLYAVFKYVLPSLGIMMVLPIYAQAKRTLKRPLVAVIVSLLPLTIPVIMLENVITRPELLVLMTLPGLLYLLGRALAERWLVLAGFVTVLTLVLFKFHELGLLMVVIALTSLILLLWPTIRRRPTNSLAVIGLVLLAAWPYLSGGAAQVTGVWHIVVSHVWPLHFRWWFLNNYVTIDGVQNGWPGWTWLEYYGYNLGLAVLVLLGMLAVWRYGRRQGKSVRPITSLCPEQLPALIAFTIFLIIAEVLPRFNVAYLPDRAWPFLMLSLCLLLPGFVKSYEEQLDFRLARWLLITSLLVSIGVVFYITDAKQGWVTTNEYAAAQFLKDQTPLGSIVVTQGGNGQLVSYFGQRIFFAEDVFAPGLSAAKISAGLAVLPSQLNTVHNLTITKAQLTSELAQTIQLPPNASTDQIKAVRSQEDALLTTLAALNDQLTVAATVPYSPHPNIYVLYSEDKFSYLYGQRAWWRALNDANASFAALGNRQDFRVVYQKGGVIIWQFIY